MNPLLRPRWIIGHLLALTAVLGFVRLGVWQLDRHEEKTDLRDAVAAGQALPPLDIAEAPEGSFRRVVAIGTYDGSLQTLVLRSHEGSSGYRVLTPLVVDGGSAVLVDRGWIPLDFDPPAPPEDLVKADGVLWPAESGASPPDEFPRVMRRIDPALLAPFAAYRLRGDYLVLAPPPVPEPFPIQGDVPEVGLGPHLGYAGQWFLFAGVVLVGYPLLLRRALRRDGLAPVATPL